MGFIYLTIYVLIGLLLYFLPAVIAHKRDSTFTSFIFWIGLFLGWTGVVWLGLLIIAIFSDSRDTVELRKLQLKQAREQEFK